MDVKLITDTYEGRQFLMELLEFCDAGKCGYVSGDALATAFKNGRQYVSEQLLTQLLQEPSVYVTMVEEKKKREEVNEHKRNDSTDDRSGSYY